MRASLVASRGAALACAASCVLACAGGAPPAPPPKTARTVSAIVLVNNCTVYGKANAKLAEKAINQLVDGCGTYSGGSVRFTATLLPGGAMEFASKSDASDTIPICVVNHPLKHVVGLTKACSLDVELEVASMLLPPAPAADAAK